MPTVKSKCVYKYLDFDIPDGFYFAPLRKDYGKVKLAHPLDEGIDYKLLNEKIIPICASYLSVPEFFGERVKQVIQRTFTAFPPVFSFIIELLYRLTVPKDQQTEECLELIRILRILFELHFASFSIIDDIADKSDMRMGKPTWHTTCEGGIAAAIYDAIFLDTMIYYIIKIYFGNTPIYPKLLEAQSKNNAALCMGQIIEIIDKPVTVLSTQSEVMVNPYKSGYACVSVADYALLHAGITDDDTIEKAERLIIEIFICMQVWNDFSDTFCSLEELGKKTGEDIKNGRPTWVYQTALLHFNDEQKVKFLKCYGSSNEQDIETVYDLFSEVNMPRLYLEYMKKAAKKCDSIIEEISHENLKRACINFKEWFYGKI